MPLKVKRCQRRAADTPLTADQPLSLPGGLEVAWVKAGEPVAFRGRPMLVLVEPQEGG